MKPGPSDWATNDTWASGPDVGDDTKLEPTSAQKGEGYYTARRPSPQIINWLLNRAGLMQRNASYALASHFRGAPSSTSGLIGAVMDAHAYDQVNAVNYVFFTATGSPYLRDTYAYAMDGTWAALGTVAALAAQPPTLDAAASHDGRVHVLAQRPAAAGHDLLYSDNLGAWAAPGTPPTVTQNLTVIGCDRDTHGFGYSTWFAIGPLGGTGPLFNGWTSVSVPPANVWTSAGSFTGGAVAYGIWHTLHPSGALGPDDPGNPAWLAMTDTSASRSTTGTTPFLSVSHGLTGTLSQRSVAYSRTSQRWVCMLGGAGAGNIAYSDDLGATWSTISSALAKPSAVPSGNYTELACDGYGTFVATDGINYWVSTDEGLTWKWSAIELPSAPFQHMLGSQFDSSSNIDDTGLSFDCFWHFVHDNATPAFTAEHSLAV